MGPQQLKELKAFATEHDEQRTKLTADEDWRSLLDYVQCLFWVSFILFRLVHLLYYLLALRHTFAPSKTLLAKVSEVGQKKSLEVAYQQIQVFGI